MRAQEVFHRLTVKLLDVLCHVIQHRANLFVSDVRNDLRFTHLALRAYQVLFELDSIPLQRLNLAQHCPRLIHFRHDAQELLNLAIHAADLG